jgi:hypothetical protein
LCLTGVKVKKIFGIVNSDKRYYSKLMLLMRLWIYSDVRC